MLSAMELINARRYIILTSLPMHSIKAQNIKREYFYIFVFNQSLYEIKTYANILL